MAGVAGVCKQLVQEDKFGAEKKDEEQRWVPVIISVRWPQKYGSEHICVYRAQQREIRVIDIENKYLLVRNLM